MNPTQKRDERFMRAATEPATLVAGELIERSPVVAASATEGSCEAR